MKDDIFTKSQALRTALEHIFPPPQLTLGDKIANGVMAVVYNIVFYFLLPFVAVGVGFARAIVDAIEYFRDRD